MKKNRQLKWRFHYSQRVNFVSSYLLLQWQKEGNDGIFCIRQQRLQDQVR